MTFISVFFAHFTSCECYCYEPSKFINSVSKVARVFYTISDHALQMLSCHIAEDTMVDKAPSPTQNDTPVIWTVHDVAVYLRMSEAKVYRLVKEKRIPVARIGKTWRFRKDLLDNWLSECTESSMKTAGK